MTGPSFLFALVTFLPATLDGELGTHPYPRDRVGFALRALDRQGWTPVLEAVAPQTLQWCRTLARDVVLTGARPETALRSAMGLLEVPMMELAERTTPNRPTSAAFVASQDDLFGHLELSIPLAQLGGSPVNPWASVTAGWLFELRAAGDHPAALPVLAGDPKLNAFLLKSIELAGIVRLWDAP